ncbi:MAG TPA: indolepyruvate ferredoxin oxidoreductase family protein [Acidimicrobiales bacterium]|nr:indolepyruvate ferredoxin oxidoreductase family protein [Acidimicrobiales bacterium]
MAAPTIGITDPPPTRLRPVRIDDKYAATSGRVLLSGIEALVRLTLDQRRLDRARGLNTAAYVSGYEGSPLGGLDLDLKKASSFLDDAGVVFSPGLNEELAATAVAGTQLLGELAGRRHDGVVGFWYGKNPGLDRAADAIRHGNTSGTMPLGGAVAFIGDDPYCKSSTLPSSCEWMARSLALPLLAPGTVADVRTLGLHAVALSRYAGVWTGLKIVADVADGAATVELDDPEGWVPAPDVDRQAHPPVLLGPQSVLAEQHLLEVRLPRAREYARQARLNRVTFEPHRATVGLVAPGLAYEATLRALADLGLDRDWWHALGLRLVRLAMPWPLDAAHVRELLAGLDRVVVVEDKTGFVEGQVKEALYGQAGGPQVIGKEDGDGRVLVPAHGSVTSELVTDVLARVFGDRLPEDARRRLDRMRRPERLTVRSSPLPARTPYFCSGCPHNRSTRAGDDQLVGLGIGCHVMVALDDDGRGHHVGMTQMGGEGAQWNGLAPFTDDGHYFQNLGDGTFFHSGSLAIRAAVAAGVDITYKLLFNQAVAMTGGQSPEGRFDVPALTRWLAVEGVRKVVVTTPDPAAYRHVDLDPVAEVRHRDDLAAVQQELGAVGGVTVLVHDDRCAAEERRLRRRGVLPTPPEKVWINQRVCEGCGDCGRKSTCLSVVPVQTDLGRKTAIHQGSCNKDFSCLDGDCPSFVVATPKRRAALRRRRAAAKAARAEKAEKTEKGGKAGQQAGRLPEPPVALPEPVLRVPVTDTLVRMPGIGGTGVVTVSRILQMAAHLDGRYAAGLEQTGLAQKGGPVVADVRIADTPVGGAVRAGRRSVDVLLGFDLLGAASPPNLAVADRDRTVAVVNTAAIPTAAMVHNTTVSFPPTSEVVDRIEAETRAGDNAYLDAEWMAEQLSEDHLATNMVLLGAAYQHGCLPVSAAAVEEAITLNGVAVGDNLAAFRWGRAAVVDRAAVVRALSGPAAPTGGAVSSGTLADEVDPAALAAAERQVAATDLPAALRPVVAPRVADLVGYQSPAYAARYLEEVAAVARAEAGRCPGGPPVVADAYARGLHKLMAYKDEYEVARLHLLAAERARLDRELGPDHRVKVLLHPPVLRAVGLHRKISLGPATWPVFRMLRAGRRLRGTALDLFGKTRMRRTERELVDDYRRLVGAALAHLGPDTAGQVAEVAALADVVRGFEDVKAATVTQFRDRGAALLGALAGGVAKAEAGAGADTGA